MMATTFLSSHIETNCIIILACFKSWLLLAAALCFRWSLSNWIFHHHEVALSKKGRIWTILWSNYTGSLLLVCCFRQLYVSKCLVVEAWDVENGQTIANYYQGSCNHVNDKQISLISIIWSGIALPEIAFHWIKHPFNQVARSKQVKLYSHFISFWIQLFEYIFMQSTAKCTIHARVQ